jgi:hypothetical protein
VAYIPTTPETRAAAAKAGETPFGGVIASATASQNATTQKKEEAAKTAPPAPATSTAAAATTQNFNLTLTIKGTDGITNAIASAVVAAGIAGVNVGGSTVHLVTAEMTDASHASP